MPTTCLIRFPLPDTMSTDQARARFRAVAKDFANPTGLQRKYFLLTEDGRTSVGIYVWDNRENAVAFNDQTLRARILATYGVEPEIEVLDTIVEVDNLAGEIRI